MKKQKRHISTEMKLIIGIVVAILVFICCGYIFDNYLAAHFNLNNIPGVIAGAVVLLISVFSAFATIGLIGCLLGDIIYNYYERKSYIKSKAQIKALPSDFVNVHFKDFDSFRLASFVDSEDITCFAKLDENGKVVYAIQLNVEYETDDYESFLEHFDV